MQNKKPYRSCFTLAILSAAIAVSAWSASAQEQHQTSLEIVEPDDPAVSAAPQRKLSAAEKEAMLRSVQERREAMALQARAAPAAKNLLPEVKVPATRVKGRSRSELPGTFRVSRNRKNTRAEIFTNSTLAEPAAINWRNKVLYAGNFSHLEVSLNHGLTYSNIAVGGGPASAPFACCDNDMVIDDFGTAYHSLMYLSAARTNGVVRIYVRRQANNFNHSCSYTHDPDGTANNVVPDYPHIRLSRNFLYMTYQGGGATRIRRYSLAQMRNCQSVPVRTFTRKTSLLV